MCGICGIFTRNPAPPNRDTLQKMTAAIAHRGPDSDGFHLAENIGLGFRRLAIIDLNTGDQPIYSENRRIVTVYNGEIYNYRALRAALQAAGHHFATQTDTEVLVHGYEEWGVGLVERLRGMYAFALWDADARQLLLVRDRLGQKPLYYARFDDQFLFASEIKALLQHPATPRQVNQEALPEYLALGYVLPPNTLFAGVHKLAPGSLLTINAEGQTQTRRYWQPSITPQKAPYPDQRDQLRQKLNEAVAIRMMSDVPLGTFLSGGVDSTTITALTGKFTGAAVRSFTVGFAFQAGSIGDRKYNTDLHHARAAAQTLGCQHHAIILQHAGILPALLPQLVYALDEPIADTAIIQTVFVAALARAQGVPVLLSGDGADETLGGYPFFQQAQRVQQYRRFLPTHLFNPLLRRTPLHKLAEKAAITHLGEQYLSWDANFSATQIRALLRDPNLAQNGSAALNQKIAALLADLPTHSLPERLGYAKLCLWLGEDSNMRYDKMAMWMSIEARSPFEDHEFVNLALGVPLRYKLQHGGKGILKDAVRDLLPPAVLTRPKWGFNAPVAEWLRDTLRPLVDEYLSTERLHASGFDPAPVRAMVAAHMEREGYFLNEIWNLLLFQLWHAIYIDQTLTPEARWSAQDLYRLSTP